MKLLNCAYVQLEMSINFTLKFKNLIFPGDRRQILSDWCFSLIILFNVNYSLFGTSIEVNRGFQ